MQRAAVLHAEMGSSKIAVAIQRRNSDSLNRTSGTGAREDEKDFKDI